MDTFVHFTMQVATVLVIFMFWGMVCAGIAGVIWLIWWLLRDSRKKKEL